MTQINEEDRKKIPDWISIKDRLPDGECLAVNKRGEMIVGYISEAKVGYIAESVEEILQFVTHWMPLPKPPQQ